MSREHLPLRIFLALYFTISPLALVAGMPHAWWHDLTIHQMAGLAALLAINLIVLALPLAALSAPRPFRLVVVPFLLFGLFYLAFSLANGAAPGPAAMLAIVRTQSAEIGETLPGIARVYGPWLVAFALCVIWLWRLPRWPHQPARSRALAMGAVLVAWTAMLLAFFWHFHPAATARWLPPGAEHAIFPGNLALNVHGAALADVGRHLSAEQRAFRFNARARNPGDAMRVVLVIGESSSAAHWQLGGYGRETNPELSRLPAAQVAYFGNVLAGGSATADTVPLILTRATPDTFSRAKTERSVISAFAESGFFTAWISNQDRFAYSEEAAAETYLSPSWGGIEGRHDGILLPHAEEMIDRHSRLFMVLHTMGSHVGYLYRVPEGNRHFSRGTDDNGVNGIDEYDDTIRFTDTVLARIIRRLDQDRTTPSVLLYVSDHGQDVEKGKRGELSQGGIRYPRSVVHVPLVVWFNDAYRNRWPELASRAHAKRQCAHHQSEVFQTLITLGQIDLAAPGESLLDPDCRSEQPPSFVRHVDR